MDPCRHKEESNLKVLLLGDPYGNPDEGMKIIGAELYNYLKACNGVLVEYRSMRNYEVIIKNNNKIDIIHHLNGPSWKSIVGVEYLIKKRNFRNSKTILTFVHPRWNKFTDSIFKMIPPDGVIVPTKYWQDICARKVNKVLCTSISGVDLNKFKPVDTERKKMIRQKLKLPMNKKIILHVGHINHGRNLFCFKELKSDEMLPIIIGSTTTKVDRTLKEKLVKSGVRVIDHYLKNICEYYQAADCYVFPTVDKKSCIQMPLSILEALACNLPVLTTAFEAVPFLLNCNNKSLEIIDNMDQLNEKIESVIYKKSDIRNNMVNFDWRSIGYNILSFYKRVLLKDD